MYSNLNLNHIHFPDKNYYQAPVHIFDIYSRRSGSFIIVPCCGVLIFMVCSNDFGKVVGNVLAVIVEPFLEREQMLDRRTRRRLLTVAVMCLSSTAFNSTQVSR